MVEYSPDSPAAVAPFTSEAAAIQPNLVALRRALHREPEVGLDLPLTQAKVLEELADLDLQITLGKKLTSVVAVLHGAKPGPTVLLRGDMDALPVEEENDLEYRSTNGAMHACGHDLHTAWLAGAARILAARQQDLAGKVLFMFQPGEESWAGARHMIDEGLLHTTGELPIAAYGLHAVPGPIGEISTRPGPMMASSNHLRVTLHGKGGHGSVPSGAIDPVPAVAELTLALLAMPTRRIPTFEPVVLTVSELSASRTINVINASASLAATVRTHSVEVLDAIEREARSLASGIAAAHNLRAEVTFNRVYPVTANDAAEAGRVQETAIEMFGAERYRAYENPAMGSEDFSFVLQQIPGAFATVGATPAHLAPEDVAYNHSPLVQFDDAVLGDAAALLAQLAWNRLEAAAR